MTCKLFALLAAAALAVSTAVNLKTVYVATLPELVIAMEDPMVGRIFMNNSISLEGEPLPTLKERLLEIEAGPTCARPCTLDAHGRSRIFNVGPGFGSGLILRALQLQNAVAHKGNGSAIAVHTDGTGGGASMEEGAFLNCTNTAAEDGTGFGGAVWGGLKSQLEFDRTDFKGNGGAAGGAVACYGCQLAIADSRFHGNEASFAGGALYLEGGNATLSLHGTVLQNNRAGAGGGGAVSLGARADRTLTSLGEAHAGVWGATFKSNVALGPGGGLFAGTFATVAMDESTFSGNRAAGHGGGMACVTARPSAIANTTFVGNVVGFPQGMAGAAADGLGGGGLSVGLNPALAASDIHQDATSVFRNVTFSANSIERNENGGQTAHGAGLLLNEGEALLSLCSWEKNTNLDAPASSHDAGVVEAVCAYGKSASAMFNKYVDGACSSCGGSGRCPQNPPQKLA
jgi:hypothetical protein